MKKIFVSIFVLGTILSSCGDTGREIESEDAKNVENVVEETSLTFSTIKEGSKVNWFATHLGGLAPHNGNVAIREGNTTVTNGLITGGKFTIGMSTIADEDILDTTERGKLEGHLKNPDFFNVDQFPSSTFEVTSVTATEGDYNSSITGNLTILDSTRSVTFNANVTANEEEVAVKSEKFSVDRTQWGLTFNKEGSEGIPAEYIISNDIGFEIDATLIK